VLKLYLVRHGHAGDPAARKGPDDSRPLVRDLVEREAEPRWWLPRREKSPQEGIPLREDEG
jgi:hypothetical protein